MFVDWKWEIGSKDQTQNSTCFRRCCIASNCESITRGQKQEEVMEGEGGGV